MKVNRVKLVMIIVIKGRLALAWARVMSSVEISRMSVIMTTVGSVWAYTRLVEPHLLMNRGSLPREN